MKTSFLNYSMSVIVSRALPDVRDGLKPVQRRIIYAMNDLNMTASSQHKKSARIVGEVIGKYHPHGDSSVYEAMVRMAQPFSYRYPLVDGHGNFGSVDGDGAAAMRYTEARMSKIAMELVKDIDKETVDFQDNYDSTEREPVVMPAKYPNLLVNGASGIAVGMATNIPPHNLGEVIDGVVAYMNNNEITTKELMASIKGPDFPTGGMILGPQGLSDAYHTGNGTVIMRAKTEIIEGKKHKNAIIVTEIPYQVNKSRLLDRIAEVAKEKIVDGITDLRDESTRKGMRIVIELRKDVNPDVMLNNLYKYTQLQSSFSINMISLVNGEPKSLGIKAMIYHYVNHQIEVLERKTAFELKKALERKHLLEGLVIALENIDEVIKIIRGSETTEIAREALMENYQLSELQARAILDMTLRRLTGLEIEKVKEENIEVGKRILDYEDILASAERKETIIKESLLEVKDKYNNPRQSEMALHIPLDIEDEDLIPVEDVIITVTNRGYVKRMTLDEYRLQNRGGVGLTSIRMQDSDFVEHIQMTNTHNYHLFFTNKGRVYKVKGYQIPEGSRQARGLPINNILPFLENEEMVAFTTVSDFDSENYLFFTTKKGVVKRTKVNAFKNIRVNGIIAITLREDDELYGVKVTDGKRQVILGASNGKAIRFKEDDVRSMGRTAAGVRGMFLDEEDVIVGMTFIADKEEDILVVTEKGYGKRSTASEYRLQNRGGKGVKALNITERNGNLCALRSVAEDEDVIIVSNRGMVIRTEITQIARTRRATQGVRLINLKGNQTVITLAIVPHEEEEEEQEEVIIQEEIALETEQEEVAVIEVEAKLKAEEEKPKEDEKEEKIPQDLFDLS
ncbi:MAG: DNA gyrase subunit A [Acholeplasmataceae bacterium]|nr:DNA gyrase subunit A [Acholeplasmataceae bacterium]MCK9234175.1 DNA gyrase subunit A [Acholeplasmataceae bacterium]MCK9289674.1 DNA gyrase subunit A [Acholeplasmataceae bacterium]MCK9427461.1 DNA gyrase subunit A [Acholeplasmataceae bacterium]